MIFKVDDKGIHISPEGGDYIGYATIPKEVFVEAYNRYIGEKHFDRKDSAENETDIKAIVDNPLWDLGVYDRFRCLFCKDPFSVGIMVDRKHVPYKYCPNCGRKIRGVVR